MTKQYTFKDNFEMLYLRHEYLTKIKTINMEDVKRYQHIAAITGHLMYEKFKPNFDKIGFNEEDIVSITNVYLISYMGLYSLRNNKQLFQRYIDKYTEKHGDGAYPNDEEINRRERNHLITFLRQRLYHCSTLCARKARNIIVGKEVKIAVAETAKSLPVTKSALISDYKQFGYRKITKAELKKAKIRAKSNKTLDLFDDENFRIIEIEMGSKPLTTDEYIQIFTNRNDNLRTPEENLIVKENNSSLASFKQRFNNLQDSQKRGVLIRFIKTHKEKTHYKSEVSVARKMLKNLKNVV